MPIDALVGAWLFLQLFHECLQSFEILFLWILLIHPCYEVSCTDLVEVIVFQTIASDNPVLVDHRVGIELAVALDVFVAISVIGVEHRFEFYTHHIAPLRMFAEIEHIRERVALHL